MQSIDNPALSARELRSFGLILGAMIALMFGLVIPWLWGFAHWPLWPWVAAAIFILWALAAPLTLAAVYKGWMRIANVLAWINTRLILGFAFFAIILPTSLLLRLLRKDPLARQSDPNASTYRVAKQPRRPDHMEKPF